MAPPPRHPRDDHDDGSDSTAGKQKLRRGKGGAYRDRPDVDSSSAPRRKPSTLGREQGTRTPSSMVQSGAGSLESLDDDFDSQPVPSSPAPTRRPRPIESMPPSGDIPLPPPTPAAGDTPSARRQPRPIESMPPSGDIPLPPASDTPSARRQPRPIESMPPSGEIPLPPASDTPSARRQPRPIESMPPSGDMPLPPPLPQTQVSPGVARDHPRTIQELPPANLSPAAQARAILPARNPKELFARSGVQLKTQFDSASELPKDLPAMDDRYEFRKELGRGGMGAVHAVFDNDLRREVAMKRVLDHAVNDDNIARFIEEGQVTGQLEHPNIVPVHDMGTDAAGRLYITMKLVRGRSLADVIDDARAKLEEGRPSGFRLARRIEILRKVIDALDYAHSRAVIHRDLKPENIMVGRFGEVQVMDWGLARILGANPGSSEPQVHDLGASGIIETADLRADTGRTQMGAILGTPGYMPPEQARGELDKIDERSDIFSVGAVFFELLTFTVPFEGPTTLARLAAMTEGTLDPPSIRARKHWPHSPDMLVPPELDAIVMKCLQKEPRNRYRSLKALREDLDAYESFEPITVLRESFVQRTVKWARRHPAKAISWGMSAVFLLLMGVVASIFFTLLQAEKTRTAERDAVAARAAAEASRLKEQAAERQRVRDAENTDRALRESAEREAAALAAADLARRESEVNARSLLALRAIRDGFIKSYKKKYDGGNDFGYFIKDMGEENLRIMINVMESIIEGTPAEDVEDDDYLMVGRMYYGIEDHPNSLKWLNKAIEVNPENTLAYLARAQTRRWSGDQMGAFADLMKGWNLSKGDEELRAIIRPVFKDLGLPEPRD